MQKENASKYKPSKIEKKENERKTFARPAESTRQTYDTTIVDLMWWFALECSWIMYTSVGNHPSLLPLIRLVPHTNSLPVGAEKSVFPFDVSQCILLSSSPFTRADWNEWKKKSVSTVGRSLYKKKCYHCHVIHLANWVHNMVARIEENTKKNEYLDFIQCRETKAFYWDWKIKCVIAFK